MKALKLLIAALAVSACDQAPDGTYSLRQTVADAIAPSGHANGGTAPQEPSQAQQSDAVRQAYQSDLARIQAGGQAVSVSTVTVQGGMLNAQNSGTEYRQSQQVVSVTVAECETAPMNIPHAKYGYTTIYLTRVNGIIYASPLAIGGCQVPYGAQSFPGMGRYPLQIPNRIIDATITISPWNGVQFGYH